MNTSTLFADRQGIFDNAIAELRQTLLEDQVVTEEAILQSHSRFLYAAAPPHTAVVYALSTEDVVKVVQAIKKYQIPLVPYGGGTSFEGQCTGYDSGSICLDISRMDSILEIHEQDRLVTCQAGCQWQKLNEILEKKGIPLFFPNSQYQVDPGVGATFGGMMSTGCSGTNAVCYGTARGEWFLNATVVLPSGEVIKTRRNARKSSVGPDLTQLFIGAEGTLGVITEVTIRLAPKLPTSVAVMQFDDIRGATQAVVDTLNAGVAIQCAELMDELFMKAVNDCGGGYGRWAEQPTVFMKLQGSQAIRKEFDHIIEEIVRRHGGTNYRHVHSQEECENLWKLRKNAAQIVYNLKPPGANGWTTDICVPVSRLPEFMHKTKMDAVEQGVFAPMIAHAGDGNMHSLVFYRPEEKEVAEGVVHRMIKLATSLNGTCSGEHGIGITKMAYLEEELGSGTVGLLVTLKRTLDPDNLFNPGKLYPPSRSN